MSPDSPFHLVRLIVFMLVQPCIVGHLLLMLLLRSIESCEAVVYLWEQQLFFEPVHPLLHFKGLSHSFLCMKGVDDADVAGAPHRTWKRNGGMRGSMVWGGYSSLQHLPLKTFATSSFFFWVTYLQLDLVNAEAQIKSKLSCCSGVILFRGILNPKAKLYFNLSDL